MIVRHNRMALQSYLQLNQAKKLQHKTLERLSSGLRINRAGDDAAGLAISEKMRGQIRELSQEQRNMQDGISLLQTAEGGLNEIHALLQRGRELAVQAENDTLAESDRKAIKMEWDEIVEEVNRIANTTEFNTIKLLNVTSEAASDQQKAAAEALQKYWLTNSEKLISGQYGLQAAADDAPLDIQFVQNSGDGRVAWVQGSYYPSGSDGRYFNQKLVLDMSDFSPVEMPNGGGSWISNDRIIAHEMVHAVMGRTMNFRDLPTWFKEGAAEFIAGADERLANDLAAAGNDFNALKKNIDAWNSTSADYSAGYAAVKYLNAEIAGEMRALFNEMKLSSLGGKEKTLDEALNDLIGMDTAGFIADFKANATLANSGIVLGDADTGAIGGGDDYSVIPDIENANLSNPLESFSEKWQNSSDNQMNKMRIGPSIEIELANATSSSLGITAVDLLNKSTDNLSILDGAIAAASAQRSRLGAYQNRLERAIAVSAITEENITAAESRIREADMAKEMMEQFKKSVLAQAAQALLAQANNHPQNVLRLLA
ncbi:flagellinolysin [Bacillus xiapuensis]|uniref:flagellinolysin n=1 Tax=Bacillus xiapuensis TaxID=2014075 RepID=UPI0012FD56D4|nr:flagellinolysin [Bacillus xiapuensis]